MANPSKAVRENVAGEFFVDATCIDCDTCRQVAPTIFGEAADSAFVALQPTSAIEERAALQALVCCPTGSIGTRSNRSAKPVMAEFPLPVDGPVYYCGFNSPKSYGGNSYFVRRSAGNWLVDSPKFLPTLVRRFEALGGIANIFLTHRDDIADAAKYAAHFGAQRIIHRAELAAQPDAERVLDGLEPCQLAPDIVAIPTPGHTAGHCCLLIDGRNGERTGEDAGKRYLFTGDHLYFDRQEQRLAAYRDYCWDSWSDQVASLRLLMDYSFDWVLPGHGQRVQLPAAVMRRQLAELVADAAAKIG